MHELNREISVFIFFCHVRYTMSDSWHLMSYLILLHQFLLVEMTSAWSNKIRRKKEKPNASFKQSMLFFSRKSLVLHSVTVQVMMLSTQNCFIEWKQIVLQYM